MPLRRMFLPLFAVVAVSAIFMAGCGDAVTMSEVTDVDDEERIASFVDDHGFFDESAVYEQQIDGLESRDAIDPVRIWREITDRIVTREVHIDQEEGTADLAVTREIWGTLNIIGADTLLYVKPMHHTGNRYATFERVAVLPPSGAAHTISTGGSANAGPNGSAEKLRHRRGPWILTSVSGTLVRSEVLTMNIDWIRIQGPSVDLMVTNPLLLMNVPDGIMRFEIGDEITVTVSGPPQDALVSVHTRPRRWPLHYNDGVFSGTWTVARRGAHSMAVQALAHDSVFDSDYPDDCLIWALPYEVGRPDDQE